MYAVVETGGKQYRVEVGTELEVELLDANAGDTVTLDRVLLVSDGDETSIGRPLVPEATVSAEIVRQDRGEKLISFKYRPKARRRVKKGHRQELHVLRIADIVVGGRSAAATLAQLESSRKTERERLEEAARRQAAEDAALAAKLAAAKPAGKAKAGTAAETKPVATTKPGGEAKPGARPARASSKLKVDAPASEPGATLEPELEAAPDDVTGTPVGATAEPEIKPAVDSPATESTAADSQPPPRKPRATKKDE